MTSSRVRLTKRTVLELYCRIFQAERALDGIYDWNWLDFKQYYNQDTVHAVEKSVGIFKELLGSQAVEMISSRRPASMCPWPPPGWFGIVWLGILDLYYGLVYPYLNQLRSCWSFPTEELGFMINRLEQFLKIPAQTSLPERNGLISLRMEFCDCRCLIEARCDGRKEIIEARSIEYFHKNPRLPTIPMSSIIPPEVGSAA